MKSLNKLTCSKKNMPLLMNLKFEKINKRDDVQKIGCSSQGVYILKKDMALITESGETCATGCKNFACFENDILVYDGSDLIISDERFSVGKCSDIFLNDNIGVLKDGILTIYDRKFKVLEEFKGVSNAGFLSDGFIVELCNSSSILRIYKKLEMVEELKGKLLFCKENVYGIQNERVIIFKNYKEQQHFDSKGNKILLAELGDIQIFYDDEEFRYFSKSEEVINEEEGELLVMSLDERGESVELSDIILFDNRAYLLGANGTLIWYKMIVENDKNVNEKSNIQVSVLDTDPDLDFSDFSPSKSTIATNTTKQDIQKEQPNDPKTQEISNKLLNVFKSSTLFSSQTSTLKPDLFINTGRNGTPQKTNVIEKIQANDESMAPSLDKTRILNTDLDIFSDVETEPGKIKSPSAANSTKNRGEINTSGMHSSATGLFSRSGNVTNPICSPSIYKKETPRTSTETTPKNPDEILKASLRSDINSLMHDFMSIKINTYQFATIDDFPEDENYELIYKKLKFLETVNENSIKVELSRLTATLNRKISIKNYIDYFDKKIKVLKTARYLIKDKSAPVYDSAFSNRQLEMKFRKNLKLLDEKVLNRLDELEKKEKARKDEQIKAEMTVNVQPLPNDTTYLRSRNDYVSTFQPPSTQQSIFQAAPIFTPQNIFPPNIANNIQNSPNTSSTANTKRTSTFSRFLNKQNDVLKEMEERK